MLIINKNREVVIPFLEDIKTTASLKTYTHARNNLLYTNTAISTTDIYLPFTPPCTEWTEVFLDNVRILNKRSRSALNGTEFESYNVTGNYLKFNQPISGNLTVICDTEATHNNDATIINVDNVQGGPLIGSVALFHEPVIQRMPLHGYARLTTDRKSIAYMPNTNYIGDDDFVFCIINNQGQQSKSCCVSIKIA